MPTVRGGGQVTRGGYQTDRDIERTHKPSMARDELNEAFAGEENSGPFGDQKENVQHSTSVKSRKTEKSKERTPIR